jgi:hypothetical protein
MPKKEKKKSCFGITFLRVRRDAESRNYILCFGIAFLRGGGESWSSLKNMMPKQEINFLALGARSYD